MIYLIMFLAFPLSAGLRAIEHTSPLFFAYLLSTIFSLIAGYKFVQLWTLSGVLAGLIVANLIIVSVSIIGLLSGLDRATKGRH